MGSLRCDVGILSFSDLFVHLFSTGKSGVLTVSQGPMKKSFYVNQEGVSLLSTTGQARSLGEMLIRTRKVSRAQLDRLLDEKAMTGKRLAELVHRYDLVNAADVETAKREHVEEELHELFSWNQAVCEFVESPAPRMIENFYSGIVVGKAATALMLESARRSDELTRLMSDLRDEAMVPMRTGPWGEGPIEDLSTDLIDSVYRGVNGRANVAQVVRRSLYPRLEALRALHALLVRKAITLVDPNQATELNLTVASGQAHTPVPGTLPPVAPRSAAPRPRKTILLMGEMHRYRTPLASLLEEAGYEVKSTGDTLPGDWPAAGPVSVAVVDVGTRSLKSYPLEKIVWDQPGRKIIAIGRDASADAKRKAFEDGANVYAVIPFTRKNILSLINTVLVPMNDLHLPFYTSDIT